MLVGVRVALHRIPGIRPLLFNVGPFEGVDRLLRQSDGSPFHRLFIPVVAEQGAREAIRSDQGLEFRPISKFIEEPVQVRGIPFFHALQDIAYKFSGVRLPNEIEPEILTFDRPCHRDRFDKERLEERALRGGRCRRWERRGTRPFRLAHGDRRRPFLQGVSFVGRIRAFGKLGVDSCSLKWNRSPSFWMKSARLIASGTFEIVSTIERTAAAIAAGSRNAPCSSKICAFVSIKLCRWSTAERNASLPLARIKLSGSSPAGKMTVE